MSPEQARGESIDAAATSSRRASCCSSSPRASACSRVQRVRDPAADLRARVPRPSDVRPDYPMGLEPIVMKALAKDVKDRYQSAREMQSDLESFVRHHQIAVSHIALNQFMQSLFEDKLACRRKPPPGQAAGRHHRDAARADSGQDQSDVDASEDTPRARTACPRGAHRDGRERGTAPEQQGGLILGSSPERSCWALSARSRLPAREEEGSRRTRPARREPRLPGIPRS